MASQRCSWERAPKRRRSPRGAGRIRPQSAVPDVDLELRTLMRMIVILWDAEASQTRASSS